MNILVTGANGQLGRSIRDVSAESSDLYIFTDIEQLDITDYAAVRDLIDKKNVDVVVNCAAYTDVEKAEDNEALSEVLNADAVGNLARAVKEKNGCLIHISTDYVFGGAEGNFPRNETQPVNPTGIYGLTKLHGEQAVAESEVNALIIRTSWLYSEYGKNFVKTMLRLTAECSDLNVVFDQVGTPTYARDLAKAIVDIISKREMSGNEGIYHFSNEGVCSWYDFAKAIASLSGHNICEIRPCHSDEFPSKVKRPAYSVLDKTKFKNTFGITIPYWRDSLAICIKNLKHS